MLNLLLVYFGKLLSYAFRFLNLGNGSTWPGHIALKVNRNFIADVFSRSSTKIILIAGTNGKTTTSSLIRTSLERSGKKVLQNESGANLLNGIASTLILYCTLVGKLEQEYAIFEVDENALPLVLKEIIPDYLILLNLFRDQLDRYGEVDTIGRKWHIVLQELPKDTTLILNADDARIAFLGHSTRTKTIYFGFDKFNTSQSNLLQHAADSIYCPNCGKKLHFTAFSFSHLGNWRCTHCGLKRPQVESARFETPHLSGVYNIYNSLAAGLLLLNVGLDKKEIGDAFGNFFPAFGRQEVIDYGGKKVQLFLSKNPTSFNQSYETIKELGSKTLLLVLNDRVPDGRDVSWIWDVDLPEIDTFKRILISGDRVYDMALRVKYELEDQRSKIKGQSQDLKFKTYEDLREAVDEGIRELNKDEMLYILPTYSAMLEVRKILTGKKIL